MMTAPVMTILPADDGAAAPLIRVNAICKRYGDTQVLSNISFHVAPGEIYGLLGANGAGKSTLIRILCGLEPACSGDVGIIPHAAPGHSDQPGRSARIGYMSQSFGLYRDLTVMENLRFFAGIHDLTRAHATARIAELMDELHLHPWADHIVSHLSGGWRQRLAYAVATVHRPAVVLLDEPTAGLDPVARRELWDLFFRLSQQGAALIVTTHYMDEAERCTRIAYLSGGRIVADGAPEEIKRHPAAHPSGTARLAVRCDALIGALKVMNQSPHCHHATIYGGAIHALVEREHACDYWLGMLRSAGHVSAQVAAAGPSLEDVFVALTAGDKRPVTAGQIVRFSSDDDAGAGSS